jgi:glutamyl/glutaminyl-tRNA synthetase
MPIPSIVPKRLNTLIKNVAKDFSLEKLSKSPARFDLQKLTWFNRQFITMMSLDEFTTRSQLLKLAQQKNNVKLRVGDYVYLVDLNTQKTFVQVMPEEDYGVDGFLYHQIGGGREVGETSIECLIRETKEETDGKLILDSNKLLKIASYQIIYSEPKIGENPDTKEKEYYDGKEHNVYFYAIDQSQLNALTNSEDENYEWRDLAQVLARNEYITYPIWKDFCGKNNIECPLPNSRILESYLAWQLDKNRANLLTDLGKEGDVILNWIKPSKADIAWKKITIEQSVENLKEIQKVIENIYSNISLGIKQKQLDLYNQVHDEIYFNKSNLINASLSDLSTIWENELKKWIIDEQKDAGAYFWPLRVALSGKQKSPSPFELLSILDLDQVRFRLDI